MKSTAGGLVISRPQRIVVNAGAAAGFTLMSDLHIGAANVDYKLIKTELEHARKHGDRILINGDVLDLILPQDRKRFDPDVLHPKLRGRKNVIGAAIEMAADLLTPYAPQIDMIGVGNHETAVEHHHGFDPLSSLIHELTKRLPAKQQDHVIHYGGYTGFVDYRFDDKTSKETDHGGARFLIWYHHGTGAGAPVTKGMIDLHRTGWVDADLIWMGHKHVRVASHVQTLHCPLVGYEPILKDVRQIITGAYFDTYTGQTQSQLKEYGRRSNYAADRGCAPQGKGGARVLVRMKRRGPSSSKRPSVTVVQ